MKFGAEKVDYMEFGAENALSKLSIINQAKLGNMAEENMGLGQYNNSSFLMGLGMGQSKLVQSES